MKKDLYNTLRAQAASLKPVVMLGNKGITDAVINELNIALTAHELIKIKIQENDRVARSAMVETLCERVGAERIFTVGKVAVLYRQNEE